jgi:hypothetical protein
VDFDKIVLDFVIISMKGVNQKIKNFTSNPQLFLDNQIKQLENIRTNNSLNKKYNIMLNQCIVLMVSYFGSAVEDIFKTALNHRLIDCDLDTLSGEEIKLSLGELSALSYNLSDCIGDIVTSKQDISFQDMQSIQRAFKEYFGFYLIKDNDVNNIIMAQACRHVIVHSGSNVSARMVKQVSAAKPRDIKENVFINDKVQFKKEEIIIIGNSMQNYMNSIIANLDTWQKSKGICIRE